VSELPRSASGAYPSARAQVTGAVASTRARLATVDPPDATEERPDGSTDTAARRVLATLAEARQPIRESERRRVYDASRGIAVLALLDWLEDPARTDATSDAVRGFVRGASAARLAVLLERVRAREAHGVIQGLGRAGLIDAGTAEIAHARVDLRATAEAAAG
jgi:hypothetical protein